jgi:MFS family permease
MNSIMGVFVAHRFAAQPWQIGLLFVVAGTITVLTQSLLVPYFVSRFGETGMASVSMMGQGVGAVVVPLVPQFWLLYLNTLVQNGVGGFIWAAMGSLTANEVELHEQGKLAGVNAALQSLMAIIGPIAVGAAYDHVSPNAPFWISATLFILGTLLMVSLKTQPQPNRQPTA